MHYQSHTGLPAEFEFTQVYKKNTWQRDRLVISFLGAEVTHYMTLIVLKLYHEPQVTKYTSF